MKRRRPVRHSAFALIPAALQIRVPDVEADTMRPCCHCGAAIENNARRCAACGQEQQPTIGIDRTVDESATRLDADQFRREQRHHDYEIDHLVVALLVFLAGLFGIGYLIAGPAGLIFGFIVVVVGLIVWSVVTGM